MLSRDTQMYQTLITRAFYIIQHRAEILVYDALYIVQMPALRRAIADVNYFNLDEVYVKTILYVFGCTPLVLNVPNPTFFIFMRYLIYKLFCNVKNNENNEMIFK